MDREGAALFQYPQRLQKELLLIMSADVVINIVAGDGIEAFVFKWQTDRIAFFKADIGNAFGFRIVFTVILRIEEDIGDSLPDAADVLIDPARVQRFEDCLSPEQHTHGFLLMLRIFSCHI